MIGSLLNPILHRFKKKYFLIYFFCLEISSRLEVITRSLHAGKEIENSC